MTTPKPPTDNRGHEVTQTPGGPVPLDKVHLRSGGPERAFAPGGPRDRSRIHLVNPADQGRTAVTALAMQAASDAAVPMANWITCAWWHNQSGAALKSLRTTWIVPPAPRTQANQLIYLFNGIEPDQSSSIVQPVLQWGDSGPDEDGVNRTGSFWSVGSWVVPDADGHTYHTPHIKVHPGDVLVGVITLLSAENDLFVYRSEFEGINGTQLTTQGLPELTWCCITLEAYELQGDHTVPYDLDSADEYPDADAIVFQHIAIESNVAGPAGPWQPANTVTRYGEQAAIIDASTRDGRVDLFFRHVQ